MIRDGPARTQSRRRWCGPPRSFPKEFNHPPALGVGQSSLAMQEAAERAFCVTPTESVGDAKVAPTGGIHLNV